MSAIFKTPEGAAAVHERYAAFLRRWPGGAEELRLATRHGETFVVASGPKAAPPLILLHGSASTSAMWMERLSRNVPHAKISFLPDAGYFLAGQTASIEAFLATALL